MTYIVTDKSTQDAYPALLFDFAQGAEVWRFCNLTTDVSYLTNTYVASSVDIGSLDQSASIDKSTLQIKLPRDNSLAIAILNDVGDEPISVTVFRGHVDDGNYVTYWKGRVSSQSTARDEVSLECEPIFTSMKRPGLRARYQKTCRHALYQRGCTLTDSDFADVASTTAVSGRTVTLASNPNADPNYYQGGMIEYNSVKRYVINHSGTTITLMRSFDDLEIEVTTNGATAVTLYPGCDHTKATCRDKFNNLVNYGGFPFIPTKNPMGGGSIV